MKKIGKILCTILLIMISSLAWQESKESITGESIGEQETVLIVKERENQEGVFDVWVFPGEEGSGNEISIRNEQGEKRGSMKEGNEEREYTNKKMMYVFPKEMKAGEYIFEIHDYGTNKKIRVKGIKK